MADNQGTMKLHILLEEQEKINLIGLLFPDKTEPTGLVWLSDHEEIAAVTSGGVVTGVKAGTAKITVKNADSTMEDSVMVLVTGKEDTGLRLSILLKPDEKCRLVAMFGDTQGTAKWSSADDTVAAVDQRGRVTAVAVGTTLITVTSEDGSMTDHVYVTVRGEDPGPKPTDEVTEPNDTPMELPEEIPQKSLEEIRSILERTPVRDSTATVSTFGKIGSDWAGSSGNIFLYLGGVATPNGKIYCAPAYSTTILVIDSVNKTIGKLGYFPFLGRSSYSGGVLAPNGKIYFAPFQTSSVLVVDPKNDTFEQIGTIAGKANYTDMILAPNGKIYCIPYDAKQILVIDPETNKFEYFGSFIGEAKYYGAALAKNGKIYCTPLEAKSILVIDPLTNTTTEIPYNLSGSKYYGGVLAPNGKIYCAPYVGTSLLVIDPDTGTYQQVGSITAGNELYMGGALAADGKIYFAPRSTESILAVDPTTNELEFIGSYSGKQKYSGMVMAPNGNLYLPPCYGDSVMEIDTGWRYKDPSVCLSPYLNKF